MADRLAWTDGQLHFGEVTITTQGGVSIHDGSDKTDYQKGFVTLTSHRILWKDKSAQVELPLSAIVFCEKKDALLTSKARLVCTLSRGQEPKRPGPFSSSRYDEIQFEFRDGGCNDFLRLIQEELVKKRWLLQPVKPSATTTNDQLHRTGISGIENHLAHQLNVQHQSISGAFQDLNKLMQQAKEMVSISKTIANKIQEKRSDLTSDETIRFRSYLLSLGIDNPVTKESAGSQYHTSLAKELANLLEKALKDTNGIMTLSDAFCRINRARGYELISPEDLLNAAVHMEELGLPVRLRVLSSGIKSFELTNRNEKKDLEEIASLVKTVTSMSADQLANQLGIPVIVARERLIAAETNSLLCRDDSIEGLRFYPNLF
ncbi:unnamed protein product [Adineta steineri]|uniref:Vacuolar protein-sorting-associated protein 36 n=1 Tax=Adineta steineri TaxID=433720 RepID=A0A814LQT5_9BILA|nr:unnamed protein product [Adineta steineri]CAF1067987.1 unnamed protein product [Adineta steineri]CAF3906012.1 unnamed protein product [Adineta steineri]CAF3914886.1 unnamed protein product [Adineta steineri]